MTDVIKINTAPATTIRVGATGSTATEISYTPTGIVGRITDTNVQSAITSLDAKIVAATITVDATIVDGSANPVAGNAVFDALALKQDVANILTSTSLAGATNTNYPSGLAAKTYIDTAIAAQTLNGLSGVVITTPTTNQILTFNGTDWVNGSASTVSITLDDLIDAVITTPSLGQILRYNGTNWVNASPTTLAIGIDDLSDVQVASPAQGQFLTYDTGLNQWINTTISIDLVPTNGSGNAVASDGVFDALALKEDLSNKSTDGTFAATSNTTYPSTLAVKTYVDGKSYTLDNMSDVVVGSPTSGQYLRYDGTNWVNQTVAAVSVALDDLSDVVITAVATSQQLRYNGTNWVNFTPSTSLDDLSDVVITAPADDQFLRHNGTGWVNEAVTIPTNLDSLTDVTITAAGTNEFLRYNGTAWVNATVAIVSDLNSLTDVVITTPATDQILRYNGTSWINGAVPPAGSNLQVQYNNGSVLAGAVNVHIVQDHLALNAVAATPSTTAGELFLYHRNIGVPMLHTLDPDGVVNEYQRWEGARQYTVWRPSATTALNVIGALATTVGTVSTPVITTASRQAAMRRSLLTSSGVANNSAEAYCTQPLVWRGNAVGLGGFLFTCRFNIVTIPTNGKFFVGLTSTTAAVASTIDLTIQANTIGVGSAIGDTAMRRVIQGALPSIPATTLGATFPRNNTTVYFLTIYAPPNGNSVTVRLLNESTGVVDTFTESTTLPSNTTLFVPRIWCSNGGTAANAAIAFGHMSLESDL